MGDRPTWCSPAQIYYPPEIPTYLKKIYDLKPISGTPTDEEVIGIHAVIQVASKVSGVPEIEDSILLMRLSDHLFSVQMAKYQSKYSLLTPPADTTYIPPVLPEHIPVILEPVSGAPLDDEIMKVQEAFQAYQELRRFPSMFDARTNMELSQHLFNIQLARHISLASNGQSAPASHKTTILDNPAPAVERNPNMVNETSNAGKGTNIVETPQRTQSPSAVDINRLMERSNQLAEHFNHLLERSTDLLARFIEPKAQSSSLAERFDQVLERLTQILERTHPSTQQPTHLAEQFNLLSERFDQLIEQSNQSTRRANELAERSNELGEKANQLAEQSNQISEKATGYQERLGEVMKNINRVLVRIQHAIVRNHKGNTISALDCLVNEKGETVAEAICGSQIGTSFRHMWQQFSHNPDFRIPVFMDGALQDACVGEFWLGPLLQFYGISKGVSYLYEGFGVLQTGEEKKARARLSRYLSSCIG